MGRELCLLCLQAEGARTPSCQDPHLMVSDKDNQSPIMLWNTRERRDTPGGYQSPLIVLMNTRECNVRLEVTRALTCQLEVLGSVVVYLVFYQSPAIANRTREYTDTPGN